MIAREGVLPLVCAGALALTVHVTAGTAWSLPLWGVCAWLAWLYRAPLASPPKDPLALLAPVSGRVVEVGETRDPWLERSVGRVRVAMAFPGIGAVASPIEGKIMDYWTADEPFPAIRGQASASRSPSCYAVWVQTDEGDDVVFAVSSRMPVSRFKLDMAPGERVGHGRRNGFVYFASFVDVLVPAAATLEVTPGERVAAVSTVLARIMHE